jgi:tetratricopeptide (TPR) repeat protein
LRSAELRQTCDAAALAMYHRASELAEQALARNPDSAGANFVYFAAQGRILLADGMAKNLFTLRSLDREFLDRAIALNPLYFNALAAKGGVLLDLPTMLGGDVDEALVLLRQANQINRGGTGMRVSLAKALYRKGRIDEAKREVRRAAHMSCVQGRKKALDDALALMEEIDPSFAEALSR